MFRDSDPDQTRHMLRLSEGESNGERLRSDTHALPGRKIKWILILMA
jgi:hypothetical protein